MEGEFPKADGGSYSQRLTLQSPWLSAEDRSAGDEILLERSHEEMRLHWPGITFVVHFESAALAGEFERAHFTDLLDLTLACVHDDSGHGILWAAANDSRLWLLSGARRGDHWQAFVIARHPANLLREEPAADRLRKFLKCPVLGYARPVLELLEDETIGLGLPRMLPLFEAISTQMGARPRLTVKLSANCEWLLLFPLEFMSAQSSQFQAAWDIEWIATAKSCTRNVRERQRISAELADLPTLLAHTAIILNPDYPHFRQEHGYARWSQITEHVLSMLSFLQAVDIQVGSAYQRHCLRVLISPDAQTVERVLRDSNTWYVIANFHVENGRWMVGEQVPFTLDRFAPGSLAHLRLLRIYHCHSMFVTGDHPELWQSVVGTLLRAGAMRVEGSAFYESYSAFLRQLVRLLTSEHGLRPIVDWQCYAAGIDWAKLLKELAIALGDDQPH